MLGILIVSGWQQVNSDTMSLNYKLRCDDPVRSGDTSYRLLTTGSMCYTCVVSCLFRNRKPNYILSYPTGLLVAQWEDLTTSNYICLLIKLVHVLGQGPRHDAGDLVTCRAGFICRDLFSTLTAYPTRYYPPTLYSLKCSTWFQCTILGSS